MACLIVPAAEAIVTTAVTKIIEKKENSSEAEVTFDKERFSTKLKRLNNLLWGGSALLAVEHFWHGEIQPFFPFLTAAANPEDAAEMLHEMSTVGVSMAVVVTLVWAVGTFVTSKITSKEANKEFEV